MNLATFDKLAYIDSLKANGVSEDQARAHAAALDTALHEAVATKADLADVKGLIADVRSEISEVRVEIAASRSETLRWVFGMMLGQTALLVALIKLL